MINLVGLLAYSFFYSQGGLEIALISSEENFRSGCFYTVVGDK